MRGRPPIPESRQLRAILEAEMAPSGGRGCIPYWTSALHRQHCLNLSRDSLGPSPWRTGCFWARDRTIRQTQPLTDPFRTAKGPSAPPSALS